jgi:ADP-ribose pyrophosphatase
MMPKTTDSKELYKGRIFDVRIDSNREGDVEYDREVVIHKGSAVIVPVFKDGTVALVRQYRHPAGKSLLEIPAGSLEEAEDPLDGARRELEEEIGVTAGRIEKLAEFYVSPGFLTEKMYLYLATDLTETRQQLEDDELIDIERIPLAKALEMAVDGRVDDAKTIIGLLLAANRKSQPGRGGDKTRADEDRIKGEKVEKH